MTKEENRIILKSLRHSAKELGISVKEYTGIWTLINTFEGIVQEDIKNERVEKLVKVIKTAESAINMFNGIFRHANINPVPRYEYGMDFAKGKDFAVETIIPSRNLFESELEGLAVTQPYSIIQIRSLIDDNKADITEAREACKAAQKFGISLQEALGVFRISVKAGLNLDNIKLV